MLDQNQLKKIKQISEEFFHKACFEANVEVFFEEETVNLKVKTDQPQILIGEKGQVLSEIQYLLKLVLRKTINQPFFVNLDINGYKEKKYKYLRELARSAADEVILSRQKKELAPMPAHERRVVHLELASRDDVITESAGQAEERRVVVRPKNIV